MDLATLETMVYTHPARATTTCTLEVKLDGSTWTDISADRAEMPMQVNYGFGSASPIDLVARTGHWVFTLDNSATNSGTTRGWYSPDSPSVRTGWGIGIQARLTITAFSLKRRKFIGRIDAIDVEPGIYSGRQTVRVTVTDWMDEAARMLVGGIGLQETKRGDQLVTTILDGAPVVGQTWRTITIDRTKVGGETLTNVAVLVAGNSTTDTWLKSEANGGKVKSSVGYDILFFADAQFTQALAFERERWTPTAGPYEFWVKVPTVSATADTVIYVVYGDASITTDQQDADATWESSYLAVYHGGTPTVASYADASGNGATITTAGGTAAGTGQVSGGLVFDATDETSNALDSTNGLAACTIEFWVKHDAEDTFAYLCRRHDGGGPFAIYTYDTAQELIVWIPAQAAFHVWAGQLVAATWTHFVFVYDGAQSTSADRVKLYKNGILQTPAVSGGTFPATFASTTAPMKWGGSAGTYFRGTLDEMRVSNVARTVGYALGRYNNQNSPSTFYTIGAEQTLSGSGVSLSSQPAARDLAAGSETYPYALDDLQPHQTTVLQAFWKIASSGLDRIFLKANDATGGVLTFEARSRRTQKMLSVPLLTDAAPSVRPGEALMALQLQRTRTSAPNQIHVTTHPRAVDGSVVVLYTLPVSSQKQQIAGNGTLTLSVSFVDPAQTAQRVGGLSPITPVATTDYTVNAQADGLGADLTANVSMTATFSGAGALLKMTSTTATLGYVTFLRVRGKGVYGYQPVITIADDVSAQASRGKQRLAFDMPYQSDAAVGATVAALIRDQRAAAYSQIERIRIFVRATEDSTMRSLLRLEPGSPLNLSETMSGLARLPFWVDGVELTIDERDNVTFGFLVEPRVES